MRRGLHNVGLQVVVAAAILAAAIQPALAAQQGTLFVGECAFEGCWINRTNLDGSNEHAVASGNSVLAVDSVHGKLYFAGGAFSAVPSNRIMRSELDGSNAQIVIDGPFSDFYYSIAVNPFINKLYYAKFDGIYWANLDGSAAQLIAGSSLPGVFGGLDVDPTLGQIYWVRQDRVVRANMDGTGVHTLVYLPGQEPTDVAVDPGQWLYVAVMNPGRIFRTSLAGNGAQDIVTQATLPGIEPYSVAIDIGKQEIYFTGRSPASDGTTPPSAVWRLAADGSSSIEQLLLVNDAFLLRFTNIALDVPANTTIPFTPLPVPATQEWSVILLVIGMGSAAAVVILSRRRGETPRRA